MSNGDNGNSCPFAVKAGTAPAPETGTTAEVAEDLLNKYGVIIVLVVLVAAAAVLNRGSGA